MSSLKLTKALFLSCVLVLSVALSSCEPEAPVEEDVNLPSVSQAV